MSPAKPGTRNDLAGSEAARVIRWLSVSIVEGEAGSEAAPGIRWLPISIVEIEAALEAVRAIR